MWGSSDLNNLFEFDIISVTQLMAYRHIYFFCDKVTKLFARQQWSVSVVQ